MNWTPEKLSIFLNKFNIQQKELAKYLGVSNTKVCYLRRGDEPIENYSGRLTAFFEAKRKSNILYHRQMINYYKNLDNE